MEIDQETSYIPRINGHMLANYIDKTVLLMAEFVSIENMKMKIKCCDGPILLVHLQEPISNHLAPNAKLQVLATVKSRNAVQCNDFIVLQDAAEDFDMALYNEAVKMLAEQEESNTYLIKQVSEHWGADNEKEINLIDAPQEAQAQGKQNGGGMSGSQSQGDTKTDQSFY